MFPFDDENDLDDDSLTDFLAVSDFIVNSNEDPLTKARLLAAKLRNLARNVV